MSHLRFVQNTARWAPLRRAVGIRQIGSSYLTLQPRPEHLRWPPARQATSATNLAQEVTQVSQVPETNQYVEGVERSGYPRKIDSAEEIQASQNTPEPWTPEISPVDTHQVILPRHDTALSRLEIQDWSESMQKVFTDQVKHFDSLERCLVWMTQQGFRFESSPAPPWLWLAILRLPAQPETLLDLCQSVASQLSGFDVTSRNRLIALLIDRFSAHGMISAVETVYKLRIIQRKAVGAHSISFTAHKTSQLDDKGELAILRALQRLVSKTDDSSNGSQAQAEIARKLLATHVKHLAGTKSRLLTVSVLDSLYFRQYLSKSLVKALETVRRRRKIEQTARWRRELFRYAVRQNDTTYSQQLLALLQEDLASTVDMEERDKTYRTILGSLRYTDSRCELFRKILGIQCSFSGSHSLENGCLAPNHGIAQSIRIASSAYSREVNSAEWHRLCRDLSVDDIKHNLALILRGYLVRDQATTAWKLWQRFYMAVEIESSLISAVVKVLARLDKIDEAIQLVDACSRLSSSAVDRKTVNELLRICAASGKLDYFQRIWEDMEKRWNIRPDEIALGNLLLATRIAPESRITSFGQLVKRSFFSETSDIQMYDKNLQDPEPEDSESPESVQKPLAGQHWWHIPHGGKVWLDWKNARALFRHILFRNHPYLANVRSPLDRGFASGIGSMVFGPRHLDQHHGANETDPAQIIADLPIDSRHNDITYTTDTFHSYISLLNKHSLGDEMALSLEWMKRLKIQPERKSLCMILLRVENSASPKQMRYRAGEQGWHKYALMTDGEWLRDWLVHWLGPKRVPTEDELADFHMHRWSDDKGSRQEIDVHP